MIRYIDDLYLTEKTKRELGRIKRKLFLGTGMIKLYIIMLSDNPSDVFEIVPAAMFKYRKYRHMDHTVIGMAESRRKAYDIIGTLIREHYEETGVYTGLKEASMRRFSAGKRGRD